MVGGGLGYYGKDPIFSASKLSNASIETNSLLSRPFSFSLLTLKSSDEFNFNVLIDWVPTIWIEDQSIMIFLFPFANLSPTHPKNECILPSPVQE